MASHKEASVAIRGVCPPMVDRQLFIDTSDEWLNLHYKLGIEPSGWYDSSTVNLKHVEAELRGKSFRLQAGSSILACLVAASSAQSENIDDIQYFTSKPTVDTPAGAIDSLNKAYSRAGISVHGQPVDNKPILITNLIDMQTGDRTFIKSAGISEGSIPSAALSGLTVVDAYELASKTDYSSHMHRYIEETESDVALLLGNHNILDKDMRKLILGYIKQQNVKMVFGNNLEYNALFEGSKNLDAEINNLSGKALLVRTLGASGVMAYYDHTQTHQAAHTPPRVISSSGAGDALAGRFIGEYFSSGNVSESLSRAALYASLVVANKDDIIF